MKIGGWTFAFAFLLVAFDRTVYAADLTKYDTKYYTIYTDISADDEKEAAIRMTKMAEEYHERTRGFAGVIRTRFPFYLFKSRTDYIAAGGMQGSAGVFIPDGPDGGKLMAIAGERVGLGTWHVVQHEGFHQFAHAVIGGAMPIWLNEGLAEYFGESIFTGDGFVTGVVPPWRESRLKTAISKGALKPLPAMMKMSSQQWAEEMNIRNYDQAWSMVHFLVHGEDGKYQPEFCQYIVEVSQGKSFSRAWDDTLGPPDGFQDRWQSWWTHQPESPTRVLYGKATVATMTSFLARAWSAKQTFANFEEFKAAVDADTLKIGPDDWLPPSLIKSNIRLYGSLPGWQIAQSIGRQPTVALTLPDGTLVTGSFTMKDRKVDQVNVEADRLSPVLKDAGSLVAAGRKQAARELVLGELRKNLKSPLAADAKKFLQAVGP